MLLDYSIEIQSQMSLPHKLSQEFIQSFGISPQFIVRAPGRLNLIGEHTDYNEGFVMPAAIDKCIYLAFGVAQNNESVSTIVSMDFDTTVEIEHDDLKTTDIGWKNYLLGVMNEFQKLSIEIPKFNCVISGNVPIGSGLSSSAAVECGFIKGLAQLVKIDLTNWEIAEIGNRSENSFLGIQSGILDQFSSVFGRKDHAMKMDCRNKTHEYVSLDLGDYSIVLINTNVKHQHTTSGYNDRPTECREAVAIMKHKNPEIKSLRDVNHEMIEHSKSQLGTKLYNRSKFIVEENQRLEAFAIAMQKGDISQMGKLLYATHDGLQHEYEVSCKELDILVDLTREDPSIAGSRMMGGGFGGCTLNLIRSEVCQPTAQRIATEYKNLTGVVADIYFVNIEDGVNILQ